MLRLKRSSQCGGCFRKHLPCPLSSFRAPHLSLKPATLTFALQALSIGIRGYLRNAGNLFREGKKRQKEAEKAEKQAQRAQQKLDRWRETGEFSDSVLNSEQLYPQRTAFRETQFATNGFCQRDPSFHSCPGPWHTEKAEGGFAISIFLDNCPCQRLK